MRNVFFSQNDKFEKRDQTLYYYQINDISVNPPPEMT